MRILILLLLVGCSVAVADVVYRWVDEAGEVHYSDRPHEGAETVTLPKAQTFSAPAPQSTRRSYSNRENAATSGQDNKQKASGYEIVEITSPMPNEVLWATGGLVKVSVRVVPELQRGHVLMIYLNDQMVEGLTGSKRDASLTEVYRGEHTLRTEVRDAAGNTVAKGNMVSFTVKQTSIQNPNNGRPAPRPGG